MVEELFFKLIRFLKLRGDEVRVERGVPPIPDEPRGTDDPRYKGAASRLYQGSLSLVKGVFRRPFIVLALLAMLYCGLFQRLRPYDLDNPWFLSFSYNMCDEHVGTDAFERVRFPKGMDGTHLFGKLAASAQCAALDPSRWLPRDASLVTIGFVIASLGLWWNALRRLGLSPAFVGCFIFLLGVWEPTVNMAGQFRYEFFSFFLMALAVWLATTDMGVLALTVAFLATETQPAALVAVIPTLLLLSARGALRGRLILQTLVAAVLSASVYAWLHPHAIQSMRSGRGGLEWNPFSGGLISVYFIYHPRHILELVGLVVGGFLFWLHRGRIARSEIGLIAALVTLFFVLMPHPNAYYMSLALPFPLLAAFLGYQQVKRFAGILFAVTGLMLGSYAYRVLANLHEGYDTRDIAAVRDWIRQAEEASHLKDEDARIVGDWSLWYAHPHFYLSSYAQTPDVERGDVYLCDEQAAWRWDRGSIPEQVSCAALTSRIPLELMGHLPLRGRQLSLYKRSGVHGQ